VLEGALHARVHVVMVEGHEHGVHHDAERDEQVHERVEHDEGKKFRQSEQSPQKSAYWSIFCAVKIREMKRSVAKTAVPFLT